MKPFPWRPGMLTTCGRRVIEVNGDTPSMWVDRHGYLQTSEGVSWQASRQPDRTDPATLGALLGAVREAHGSPDLHLRPIISMFSGLVGSWGVCLYHEPTWTGLTEFDALMAAWEAAP